MMKGKGKAATAPKRSGVFSEAELEAMKEAKRERRRGAGADGEAEALAKIAEMSGSDRVLAERIHTIVRENAPALSPKTWYGMPAYADSDGKVVCFFQPAQKFKYRYATLGFNEAARLDEGNMWPTAFALTRLTPEDEKRIAALVRRATG